MASHEASAFRQPRADAASGAADGGGGAAAGCGAARLHAVSDDRALGPRAALLLQIAVQYASAARCLRVTAATVGLAAAAQFGRADGHRVPADRG